MENYNLTLNNMKNNYFHFTPASNLPSIEKLGLIPKKDSHAKYIEESKKVFFV